MFENLQTVEYVKGVHKDEIFKFLHDFAHCFLI